MPGMFHVGVGRHFIVSALSCWHVRCTHQYVLHLTDRCLALVLACSSVGAGAVGGICACGAAIGLGIVLVGTVVALVAFVLVCAGVGIDPFIEDAM